MEDSSPARTPTWLVPALLAAAFVFSEFSGNGPTSVFRRRQEIADLEVRLKQEAATHKRNERAAEEMQRWKQRSHSSEPAAAATAFQRRILEIAEQKAVGDLLVQPGIVSAHGTFGHKRTFTVRGRMTPDQFSRLVDGLYTIDALYRVTKIGISSSPNAKSMHNKRPVELMIELLSLHEAENKPLDRELENSHLLSDAIAKAGRFEKFIPTPPPPPPAQPEKESIVETLPVSKPAPPPNLLKSLRFVGSFFRDGFWRAWLYDAESKKSYQVKKNDRVTSGSYSMLIESVQQDTVLVNIDDAIYRIPIGEFMASHKKEL